MAYMSQEKKKELSIGIKQVLKKYDVKGTISVEHYSTLIVKIKHSHFDFKQVLTYVDRFENKRIERKEAELHANLIHKDTYTGKEGEFLYELAKAMMDGNYDNSDSMTDYFDVGYYAYIKIGTYDKSYQQIA